MSLPAKRGYFGGLLHSLGKASYWTPTADYNEVSIRESIIRFINVNQLDVGLFQSMLTSDMTNMLYWSTYGLVN